MTDYDAVAKAANLKRLANEAAGAAEAMKNIQAELNADLRRVKPADQVNEKRVGPRPEASQIKPPASHDPYFGLTCQIPTGRFGRKCGKAAQGFRVTATHKFESSASIADRERQVNESLGQMLYGSPTLDDAELVTRYNLPPDRLSAGLAGQKPESSQVPGGTRIAVCLAHLYYSDSDVKPAAPVAQETPGIESLDKARQWKVEGADPSFVSVFDGKTHALITRAQWEARVRGEL